MYFSTSLIVFGDRGRLGTCIYILTEETPYIVLVSLSEKSSGEFMAQ